MHYVWLHLQNSTIDQTTDRKASKGISCVKRGGKVRLLGLHTAEVVVDEVQAIEERK